MSELRMPSLGADMTEGKVTGWLVKPGDRVRRGDLVAEVDTEKTVMEVESFEEGIVTELLVDIGETVPVGTAIARIDASPADHPPTAPAPAGAHDAAASESAPVPVGVDVERAEPPEAAPADARRIPSAQSVPSPTPVLHVTPPVRRLAHELGVDLDHLSGTGQHGAITRADVERAAETGRGAGHAPAAPLVTVPTPTRVRSSPGARRLAQELGVDLAAVRGTGPAGAVTMTDVREADAAPPSLRTSQRPARAAPGPQADDDGATRAAKLHRAVGALMARSKDEIPHYYLSTTIDLRSAMDWMRRTNVSRPITSRLVPSALLLAATAKAAKASPEMNGFFVDGSFRQSEPVHLGIAIAMRGGGLLAPAIHDAETLSVDQIMVQLRDLVKRAEAGRLQRAEMADPTITVTNLGDLGVETIFGVIYPPQVALVGFGSIREQPVARDGLIGVHPTVVATLSADHRVSDGLAGSRFLASISGLLQNPEEL
jgi:pyruvate dehydrogenase E2 component (dihydrolipoamide acetyltransferase)